MVFVKIWYNKVMTLSSFFLKGMIILNNIGKTPLLRAKKIEDFLGIKKIYIKLEGNNPTRSKYDRIARIIVKNAKALKKSIIIIDGKKRLLRAMAYVCDKENMKLQVPLYKNQTWKAKLLHNDFLVDFVAQGKSIAKKVLVNLSVKEEAYFYVDKQKYEALASIGVNEIVEEINTRLDYGVDNFYYASDYCYTYMAYKNTFTKENIKKQMSLPRIYGVRKENTKLYDEDNKIAIDDKLLKEANYLLHKFEHLKVKEKDAIAFAGFLKMQKENQLDEGNHVIVLDTAKSRVSINQLEDFSVINKLDLIDYVDNYLDRYSDSKIETIDAVENAMKNGYILTASRDSNIDGVCIIVNMGFDEFIPTYHLAYIGINPRSKGRGLGSELIKEAINLTKGKISLHVDLDNKNAKKLYKKMGFKHVYDRMIYQSDEQ